MKENKLTPLYNWVVVSNGIEDDPDVCFTCATKEIAVAKAQERLENDLLETSEYDDEPPDVEEDKHGAVIVSYDDYMSYKIVRVEHYNA